MQCLFDIKMLKVTPYSDSINLMHTWSWLRPWEPTHPWGCLRQQTCRGCPSPATRIHCFCFSSHSLIRKGRSVFTMPRGEAGTAGASCGGVQWEGKAMDLLARLPTLTSCIFPNGAIPGAGCVHGGALALGALWRHPTSVHFKPVVVLGEGKKKPERKCGGKWWALLCSTLPLLLWSHLLFPVWEISRGRHWHITSIWSTPSDDRRPWVCPA